MQLFTVSSWGLWFGLCHNNASLSHAARSLFLDSNISKQERHFQLLALGYGRLLRVFRANDLKGTVSHDSTDGSYCSQPWDKKRPN